MIIKEHLDKNNLHHAYLIEGERDQILQQVFEFIESIGIKSIGNADVSHISLDSFKIDDARNLKSFALERSFSPAKKIFIISTNSFLLEAQNSLLKMFEEPIENTHFFLIIPDTNALLPTLVSRFYFISTEWDRGVEEKQAEQFIAMPLRDRMEYIKDLLVEEDLEEEPPSGSSSSKLEVAVLDSARSKALKFLNALETVMSKVTFDTELFHHIFKVREFLRQPGSSPKTLLESVALIIPEKI